MEYRNIAKGTTRIAVFVAAALFLVSLADSAAAGTFSITGKVVAIDRHKVTLTVDASPFYGPNGRHVSTFALDKHAYVMLGHEKRDFKDIKTGDWVIISFHEESGGLVVADGVAFTSPPLPYVEANAGLYSLTGKIVAIDRGANSLTVSPLPYYGENYSSTRVFVFDSGTWVTLGNERREFRDLKTGDWVTVNFRLEKDGLIIAKGIAVTYPPVPYMEERARLHSLTGKVVALDRDAKTLGVAPSYCEPYYMGAHGTHFFALDRGTTIMMGNELRDIRDIRIGDLVTVRYHLEANGLVIADGVAISFPPVLTCPEARG
jgi:hypothetical protein